ncbi:unnamed protein product [Miscanthus lutarioriparius]|uniref:Ergosterol biosynthetic protein 28 n=1 Tax=Miscanthus lutarioriparius TaxID=422564 RepID=A0A811RGJ6_9POAL|nr:unnamed protein product [Miscanthus lutarioriparius]
MAAEGKRKGVPALGWWLMLVGSSASPPSGSASSTSGRSASPSSRRRRVWRSNKEASVSPSRGIREFELREYSEWSPLVDPSEKPVRLTRTENVTDVHGRTFGVWTLLTCTLCFLCALNLENRPLYLATFLSFIYALGHFLTEYLIYHTMAATNLSTVGFFAATLISSLIYLYRNVNHMDASSVEFSWESSMFPCREAIMIDAWAVSLMWCGPLGEEGCLKEACWEAT